MRRIVPAGFVVVALCLTATSASAASQLVKNGGFERPAVPPGSYQVFVTGTSFSSWKVVGAAGQVGIVSGTFSQSGIAFPAKAGAQWLDLTGNSQTVTGVSQTVQTTPGAVYKLSFAVGNVVNPGGPFGTTSTVDVVVDGLQILAATNTKGKGTSKLTWKAFSKTFTATSADTTIALMNGDPSTDTANGLDAVKLVRTT